jgi:hypothetical protein
MAAAGHGCPALTCKQHGRFILVSYKQLTEDLLQQCQGLPVYTPLEKQVPLLRQAAAALHRPASSIKEKAVE